MSTYREGALPRECPECQGYTLLEVCARCGYEPRPFDHGFELGHLVNVYSPDADERVTGEIYYLTETYMSVSTDTGRCVGGPIARLRPVSSELVLPSGETHHGRLQTGNDGEPLVIMVTCGHCGFAWNDALITGITPTPAARCPNEYGHEYEDDDESDYGICSECGEEIPGDPENDVCGSCSENHEPADETLLLGALGAMYAGNLTDAWRLIVAYLDELGADHAEYTDRQPAYQDLRS